MSVLIKGMDKPKNCYNCWLKGCVHKYMYFKDCPIIEVSTPHGRLIDADKLLEHKTDHDTISTHLVWNAPLVIESERSNL